jgi:hypothetical protein
MVLLGLASGGRAGARVARSPLLRALLGLPAPPPPLPAAPSAPLPAAALGGVGPSQDAAAAAAAAAAPSAQAAAAAPSAATQAAPSGGGNSVGEGTDEQGNVVAGQLVVSREVLGHGSMGTIVFRGTLGHTNGSKKRGRPVAVKRLLQEYHLHAAREIRLLIESDGHPNVVRKRLRRRSTNRSLPRAPYREVAGLRSFDMLPSWRSSIGLLSRLPSFYCLSYVVVLPSFRATSLYFLF